ncbi:hypothetical protein BD626DRAFT_495989 [Schizophyllum amplum]|uniref:Uncharacterized protein n=1 Tax=Schizophyllum amplum TaxID=97359 RepID=A0A550CEM7_9AGAR|nr:hypothetical protein BD626DRAFT_495989 [Auriculariopsis ampla]
MATLPPHVPALLETLSGSNFTFYGIRMYGRIVIVQADAVPSYAQYHHPDDGGSVSYDVTLQDAMDARKQRIQDIEMIQMQLKAIKWQACSWAYLNRKNGRLIQRERRMYRIAYPTWTTLIEESEITLTKFIDGVHRQGCWRGVQVDVFIGWTDDYLRCIERAMRGYRQLQRKGLDFAYEILGHVVRDGHVVGYVTEAMTGRMVESYDQKLVYSAVARLHSAGLTYTCFCDMGLMVCGGKLKFSNLSGLSEDGDEASKTRNWQSAEELFALDRRGVPNMFPSPSDAVDQFTVLSIVPELSRLYDSNFFSCTEILSIAFRQWQQKGHRDGVRREKRARRAAAREDWDGTTVCSSRAISKAGFSRAHSIVSDASYATSNSSTVERFRPYGTVMRNRILTFDDDGETSTVFSEGMRTDNRFPARGVSL